MSQVIRISDDLYKRLEALATGFDTPSNVIETILNTFERKNNDDTSPTKEPSYNLDIEYSSGSEEIFKKQVLERRKAFIHIYYTNNTSEIKEWNASRFSETSSIVGNLRSGFLRGWQEKGIYKAKLSVNKNEL